MSPAIADASTRADIEFLVIEAILALADRWGAAQPVVPAIDAVQWADRATLLVVHRLGLTAAQLAAADRGRLSRRGAKGASGLA